MGGRWESAYFWDGSLAAAVGPITLRDSAGQCNARPTGGPTAAAGTFEIHQAGEGTFLFRLTAGDGAVVAVSPRFTTLKGAVDGITAVRENAAAGFAASRSIPARDVFSSGFFFEGVKRPSCAASGINRTQTNNTACSRNGSLSTASLSESYNVPRPAHILGSGTRSRSARAVIVRRRWRLISRISWRFGRLRRRYSAEATAACRFRELKREEPRRSSRKRNRQGGMR